MVDAFLCSVLDVFGLASIESAVPGTHSLPWASFQGPEHNAFDLDSRFLVASRPASDLLLFAKHLFVGARTMWWGSSNHAARAAGQSPSPAGHRD